MAFIRNCSLMAVCTIILVWNLSAQTVFYPVNSSRMLQSTAEDMAALLQSAIPGSRFSTQPYNQTPATGIIFKYDSTITDNQLCKVSGNGAALLEFTAQQDNGLVFGIYQYLQHLGFKFYQPGKAWEIIPALTSAFKNIHKEYNTNFKYKSWFISGGHRIWLMDKTTDYNWENYIGENGHAWALYQRRNGMLGAHSFRGHRGDIINGNYLSALQNNPCYVASYNGSRIATTSSVPDVNNTAAMNLWANTIEQKYVAVRNNIFSHPVLYANQYRNFNYNNQYIGTEVPDGPRWANSSDNTGCSQVDYISASNQSIVLANNTAQKIKNNFPEKRFQVYAYFTHANIPSASLKIDSSIEVQVIPSAFQSESSAKGLMNRWYNTHPYISEYHYLNIPQWSGETPALSLKELKLTVQRLKDKHSQGIIWESSPAKFASLPFLRAANESLINGIEIDSSLKEFCSTMFGPSAEQVYSLLQLWSSDEVLTEGYFFKDNKYKIPLYFKKLQEALQQANPSDILLRQRFGELKAYLHYVKLYYSWIYDYRSPQEKKQKGEALCIYLAQINKMQLVNSYYLITGIANSYGNGSSFFAAYNVFNGTAYQNGNLPLITAAEIENNYNSDITSNSNTVTQYKFLSEQEQVIKVAAGNLIPAASINVDIGYTNAANYSNRAEFNIYAKDKGNFNIKYSPKFNMPGKGYINFTVENENKTLGIVKDFNLTATARDGNVEFELPEAGFYKLSVVSKFQSAVKLQITTNGNAFYKNTAFTHRYAEKYNTDMSSFPGYFYVPQGLQRIYFSISNAYTNPGGFIPAEKVSSEFNFKDNFGKTVYPVLASSQDSTLFFLEIPAGQGATFWQVSTMGQYLLCFANISNTLWYGKRRDCNTAYTVSFIKTGDECFTKLTAAGNAAVLRWEVDDAGTALRFGNIQELVLPATTTPNAIVTLFDINLCSVTKKISDAPNYFQLKESCATGAAVLPVVYADAVIYPNPSPGIFNIKMHANSALAEITIMDNTGRILCVFKNTFQFNISQLPPAVYWYKLKTDGRYFTGKIFKK